MIIRTGIYIYNYDIGEEFIIKNIINNRTAVLENTMTGEEMHIPVEDIEYDIDRGAVELLDAPKPIIINNKKGNNDNSKILPF